MKKGVYTYLGYWKKFNETSLPEKEEFYSNLTMEDIPNADYAHGKKGLKRFLKKLREYHDLYVQSNTLLLADVFESFRNMFLAKNELDPAHFLSAPGLASQTGFKKTKVKLDFLTDIDMLLLLKKSITGEIYHSIY